MEKMNNMKLLMLCCLALTVICHGASIKDSPPKFPSVYTTSGVLQLPYAEIKEPFVAMFDGNNKRSRIEYYNGTNVNIIRGDIGDYGVTYELAPMTTYKVRNKRMCFGANGTSGMAFTPQSILPDLTGFQKMDPEMRNGRMCDLWKLKQQIDDKVNYYSMWVDSDTQAPVRYEMYGYDSLLGSHFDLYYLDYEKFASNISIPAEAFNPPKDLKCGGFPGPGAESRLRMNPMREFIHNDDSHIDGMFQTFKQKHNKQYEHDKEHQERKHVFQQNLRYINSINRKGLSYSVAVNHLADRSAKELKMMNGYRYSKQAHGGQQFNAAGVNVGDMPVNLDWRIMGIVSQVKDQGVCGSCWSFGTTGTIESSLAMKTGIMTRLSQQQLVDCSWGEGNNGCDGGEDFRSYDYIMKKGGLSSEEQYGQYKAADGLCHDDIVSPVVKLTGFVNVTTWNATAMKIALFKNGPISVAIDAAHKSLSFYSKGVYYEPTCGNKPDDLDHAVLAVGYGIYPGTDKAYWIIKNSWSTYWGNDGFALFDQKDNMCGVLTTPTYANVVVP